MKKRIAILGSTGSIGTQTLDIVAAHWEEFEVTALSAHSNVDLLQQQIARFSPAFVGVADRARGEMLRRDLPKGTQLAVGEDAIIAPCCRKDVDIVVLAVVGISGLAALMQAIACGKKVALANKEALVCGGRLVKDALAQHPEALIVPVDSEHSAIFQCLQAAQPGDVERLILTGSGGPFRLWERDRIAQATKEMALNHPVWSMGAKITVDSASMMNKGLEVIEAHYLFDMPPEDIDVVVHPQGVVHSMVEMRDGAILAQMGHADMRLPIQYALGYPGARRHLAGRLDVSALGSLEFEPVQMEKFPCFGLARQALLAGGTAPVALNAANEVAVALFLQERIRFGRIAELVEEAVMRFDSEKQPDLQTIFEVDAAIRDYITKKFD
ncbi:MAG: 1-deoxy-D-xylulose-5-phosphate reductoisomerase [Christensenellales bacterium]